MGKLNNNRGVLLISVFMVAGIMFTLSGAYVTSSIVQDRAVQREKETLQAFYCAELGAEYAFIEAQNHSWNFNTHEVAATDLDGDGKLNDLIPVASPPTGGFILNTSITPATGCYQIYLPDSNIRAADVKVYANPAHTSESILLSRGRTQKDNTRILKNKLANESLYKYLFFFPQDTTFYNTYDGKNAGGIHVNGNLYFYNNSTFTNLTEISASGYFSFKRNQYYPPYEYDDYDGVRDGKVPLLVADYPPYNTYLPYLYHNNNPWGAIDLRSPESRYFHGDSTINGVHIPKELSTPWQWDKYSGNDASSNPGGAAELPVSIVVPQSELDKHGVANADEYWVHIYGAAPADVNPEWWVDKKYGNDRAMGEETTQVRYTDSQYQAYDWHKFLYSNGLDTFVRDSNSGGNFLTPINVNRNYYDLAKNDGMYVGDENGDGTLEIYLNRTKYDTLPCWAEDNVQFMNAIRPHVVATDAGDVPVKENVIQFDIAKLLTSCPSMLPRNNILYVDKDVRIVNAQKLPDKGLTVVSPHNVYLKGDFNTDADWQPSAVITDSMVYGLSEGFNDPQTFPLPYTYKNYPYNLQFQEFLDQYCEGGRYPAGFPPYPLEGLTWDWIRTNLSGSQQLTLLNSGENFYRLDNADLITNKAKDTVYNVAISAAQEDPVPDVLEQWESATMTVTGSFIQLENIWSHKDIPDVWRQPNSKGWGNTYMTSNPSLLQCNYEDRYKSQGITPPGDFGSSSVVYWEMVSDFNHS